MRRPYSESWVLCFNFRSAVDCRNIRVSVSCGLCNSRAGRHIRLNKEKETGLRNTQKTNTPSAKCTKKQSRAPEIFTRIYTFIRCRHTQYHLLYLNLSRLRSIQYPFPYLSMRLKGTCNLFFLRTSPIINLYQKLNFLLMLVCSGDQ